MEEGWDDNMKLKEKDFLGQLEARDRQEGVFWEQKARVKWLQEGERNTKFFHNSIIQNRNSSKIHKLKKMDGSTVETRREIEEELSQHFSDIRKEYGGDRSRAINRITNLIPRTVTKENNEMLIKLVSMQEVEEVINQMAPAKAPRPDGFTSNFFHHFWDLVKEEVLEIVEEFKNKRGVLKSFNTNFISLVPKEVGADRLDKFRPIDLCNVIYKIISKVIINRLKPLLPKLISSKKLGFVERRHILDGVILVHEMLHSLKSSRTPGMMIKLDIVKAYDKLSWQYINKMLESYGLSTQWVDWVMGMVTSPFFSILYNGSPSRVFYASRGIRQGDSLSL